MMRSKFDEQLDRLNKEMMKMGSAIEDSIRKAVDALVKQDAELAKKVMLQDEEIDREQKTIESICFNLLIQQQPVLHTERRIAHNGLPLQLELDHRNRLVHFHFKFYFRFV